MDSNGPDRDGEHGHGHGQALRPLVQGRSSAGQGRPGRRPGPGLLIESSTNASIRITGGQGVTVQGCRFRADDVPVSTAQERVAVTGKRLRGCGDQRRRRPCLANCLDLGRRGQRLATGRAWRRVSPTSVQGPSSPATLGAAGKPMIRIGSTSRSEHPSSAQSRATQYDLNEHGRHILKSFRPKVSDVEEATGLF